VNLGRIPRPRGLRSRLTVWVATVLLVAAAVTLLFVYRDTGTQLRAEVDTDITGDAGQLAHSLPIHEAASPAALLSAAEASVRVQPYSEISTLLFVIVHGAGTASNHPELLGSEGGERIDTRAQLAQEHAFARVLVSPHVGFSTHDLPDVGAVRVYELRTGIGGVPVYVGAGEPLASVARAQHSVARALLLAAAITLGLALISSYLAGARVSAPLRRLAAVAARVDAGDLDPRMPIDRAGTDEVQVLADAFNHMLDRLADAFTAQREFVADASHELRTPLTVIRGQLELLAAQEHPDAAEVRRVERLVQAEISRVTRLVDDLLLLAHSERGNLLRPEPIELAAFVSELWDGVSLTAERRFELGTVPEATLTADPDRLAQALRNLARNAIEHTAEPDGLVRLEVQAIANDQVRFAVLDDGPGIPADERERIFERFHRVDASRSRTAGGAGLGLAIVRAIVDAHGGRVRAGAAPSGGALVELELPGLTLAPVRRRSVAPV
jgi:signal transduction histidine kinase